MRMMIARELVIPSRFGNSPASYEREGKKSSREKIQMRIHSVRTASAMSNRLARQAGTQPATMAAPIIHAGVQLSVDQGKASRIVHPKKARLITPVKTSARQSPE